MGVAAGAVVAVLLAVVAAGWSGATAASALLDAGPAVRWGLPALTVLAEITAAVAIGGAMLAAVVLPRHRPTTGRASRQQDGSAARDRGAPGSSGGGRASGHGDAWPSTMLVVSVAAGLWATARVAHLVLTYASVAGTSPTDPGFGAELGLFLTSISLGRTLLAITVVAALTCAVALLVTGPRGALVTALLATTALVMQSTTGHAAGASNHELALSSMFLHLTGAALWLGGLAALALVAHRLGPDLRVAVARYSPVAAWSLVAVGVSGVVNALPRLGGLDGLTTRYGLLVLAKVALTAALGGLGWWHRRVTIPRLEPPVSGAARTRAPALFWRLVAVELAVMGAVSGVAAALGATEPPTPLEPPATPTPAELVTGHPLPPEPTALLWLTSFRWDLLPALGCLAAVVVYLRWVRRLRARGDAWPLGRTVSLVVGVVVLAWATSGGAAVYGHVLFSAHMVQHMVLVMVVPIFLTLSAPVTLASRALPARTDGSRGPREWLLGLVHSRWATFFAHPVVAAVNFAGSMIVFYYTDLFELALTTYVGHLAMIAHFTLAGYLFVNALVGVDPGPRRPAYPVRLVLLFATMAFHAFFGVALVSDETLLVPRWFGLLGRPWGPSAIEDQQIGGAVAWGISELPMLALAIVLAVSWTRDDERTARRRDRAAERDGDAELTEYNAMLERLGRQRG